MFKLLRNKKGQNTMEYALLISIVIGALTGMQLYLRRGLNARLKAGSDNIPGMVIGQAAAQFPTTDNVATVVFSDNVFTKQYDPYYSREGAMAMNTTSHEGNETITVAGAGTTATGTRVLAGATNQRTGSQTMTGMKTTTAPTTVQE